MDIPPFCPRPDCPYHEHPPKSLWWRSAGTHRTICFGQVLRFQCLHCFHTFSTQTFSTNYYAKRKIDYRRLELLLSSSMSLRSLGRTFDCSCGSILNRVDRLSRQALASHSRLRPQARRDEDVCIDGLVSFDRSQYFPNNITLSVTSKSRYVLSFTHATLRRSGKMRSEQKEKRNQLYRGIEFESRPLERSFTALLDELDRDRPPGKTKPLIIITDEKKEYERAFLAHRLYRKQDEGHRVVHRTVNSRLPRTCFNPLFPSNYLDREIRKDQASHRRETTCLGRNVANGLSRMACYLDWHNYSKRFLIKAQVLENETHGEEAGIPREEIESSRSKMFEWRSFFTLTELDATETKIWGKSFPTPGIKKKAYLPAFALG
jgi:hypothetical protein